MSQAEAIRARWMRHRGVLEDLIEASADVNVDFAPWEGAMPFGKLAAHTAASTHMFAEVVSGGSPGMADTPSFSTMSDVLAHVKDFTAKTDEKLQMLSDDDLEQTFDMMGMNEPGHFFLTNAIDHEIHHKGQLYTYARTAGVEDLPFFTKTP
ncbi:DinB family protein [Salibacterium halotolerans]|uniref:Uncharacterized damage-inducible protein DinB (Forms a four-helix bundle) n=1 Tax=Salibacterium halotolerans TaxID=1884432 RepID=A0A1I5SAJ8_9BACI|nr:DinB family protein [Salibacterium halotolerans]SFP67808.1 Uncharacterized damage-inducible protein DinB (forms a four-helix bundle) [Salibacterium halotolerans]